MLLFPLTLVAGVVLGTLLGGRFRSLAGLPLRFPAVLVLALVLQAGMGALGNQSTRVGVLVASYVLVGAWLVANLAQGSRWHRAGLTCLTVGYALNVAAIVPNGNMPVSIGALRRVGGSAHAMEHSPNLDKHVAFTDGAPLSLLGDVVPVDALRAVISVGDIAMVIGIVIVIAAGMSRPRAPHSSRTTS